MGLFFVIEGVSGEQSYIWLLLAYTSKFSLKCEGLQDDGLFFLH